MRHFSNLFISVRRSTCFRRFFRPSSGAQNCTYSVRHLSDRYWYLLLAAGTRQAFVRPLLVPAASSRYQDGKKLSETCTASYRNKWIWETLPLVGCTLRIINHYEESISTTHGIKFSWRTSRYVVKSYGNYETRSSVPLEMPCNEKFH